MVISPRRISSDIKDSKARHARRRPYPPYSVTSSDPPAIAKNKEDRTSIGWLPSTLWVKHRIRKGRLVGAVLGSNYLIEMNLFVRSKHYRHS